MYADSRFQGQSPRLGDSAEIRFIEFLADFALQALSLFANRHCDCNFTFTRFRIGVALDMHLHEMVRIGLLADNPVGAGSDGVGAAGHDIENEVAGIDSSLVAFGADLDILLLGIIDISAAYLGSTLVGSVVTGEGNLISDSKAEGSEALVVAGLLGGGKAVNQDGILAVGHVEVAIGREVVVFAADGACKMIELGGIVLELQEVLDADGLVDDQGLALVTPLAHADYAGGIGSADCDDAAAGCGLALDSEAVFLEVSQRGYGDFRIAVSGIGGKLDPGGSSGNPVAVGSDLDGLGA